jgi:segregation and condensation protein B
VYQIMDKEMNLENKIEAVLFFKNEPLTFAELAKFCGVEIDAVKEAVTRLQALYKERGIVIINDGENVAFGTSADLSDLIEGMQKEELSRELGRAGLETLAIVLYKGPVTRREIDYIRGVNSAFILRTLLVRGLVERVDSGSSARGYGYKPTLKLFEYLGVTSKEDLPEYENAFKKMEAFVSASSEDKEETNG